jgi:DNA helicase-2/ATP-dependent DNA helicase PcrA
VTLSTVHRVKGREWPRVAVVGVTAGVVPHRLAVDVEEERRVLHVAVTRGRQRVVVLGDRTRPSPFLAELAGTAPALAAVDPGRPTTTPGRGPARRSGGPGPGEAPLTGVAGALEDELRAWRRRRADGKPAYTVASNATLRAVAEARPGTRTALGRIAGIGPTTLERYGDELLELVARFADDTA